MASIAYVSATGNKDIDGLLSGYRWAGTLTYSFPDAVSDYEAGYGYGEPTVSGFAQVSAQQQQVVHAAMKMVGEYTNLTIEFTGTNGADIRTAQSSEANPTAYAYYPSSYEGGDIWFGTSYNYRAPKLGDYYYLTHVHELGHALGLKHSQETEGPANTAVPANHDALEYTVMSYRSYVGGATSGGYTNETYGYPTTFMMNDIRALQEMYGADFTTKSGNTIYRWSATTGETFIDEVGQGRPGGASAPASANNIFMTVWDGGGTDTYDFSNYATGLVVDLNPGAYTVTTTAQRAYLGDGQTARGNVYNAYLYNNDARSYIENAVGGSGADRLTGNAVANRLDGGAGNDTLTGGAGSDIFVFRSGIDVVTDYSVGFDKVDLSSWGNYDSLADVLAIGSQIGANAVLNFGISVSLTLQNVALSALSMADFVFAGSGTSGPDTGDPAPVSANEAPTAISLGNSAVDENLAGGIIGSLIVSDADDTAFTFGVSDARFQVTGTPGNYSLKLVSGASLDFEAEPTVHLSVTATDAEGLSFTQAFDIAVADLAGATITGTERNDVISGTRSASGQPKATAEDDVIQAAGGHDTVYGLGGDDQIDGGTGNDYLSGDAGNDRLTGGAGSDRIYGGAGNDIFFISGADAVSDVISGGRDMDTVEVAGAESVTLNSFLPQLDSMEVWQGNGQGVLGTSRANILDFGGLQTVSGLAYIDAGAGNDVIRGTGAADDLRGGIGNDLVCGNGGDDRITGGAGADTLDGGDGDDTFVVAGSDGLSDVLRGGAGLDRIEVTGSLGVTLAQFNAAASSIEIWLGNGEGVLGTTAANTLDFSGLQSVSGMLWVDGGYGNDRLKGSSTADDLRGGIGNDVIHGNAGDDRITGGAGSDTLDGGDGDDTFAIAGTEGLGDMLSGGGGADSVLVTGTANVTLAQFDAAAASIESWQGNSAGVLGTTAANTLDFSGLQSVSGMLWVDGGYGNDRIGGSSAADDLRGGIGNDTIHGNAGDDRITGGAGSDTLDGGDGDDTFVIAGAEGLGDVLNGGGGTDSALVTGTANVTLAQFDAAASSIENWQGNGAGVLGTSAANVLDFGYMLEITGLSFIDAGHGNDRIVGSSGADDLRGGAGNDTLLGGLGDDVLRGGSGSDVFAVEGEFGDDRILDFEAGANRGDVISFSASLFSSVDEILAATQQVGADAVIDAGEAGTLTLQNVQLSALHAGDFQISQAA